MMLIRILFVICVVMAAATAAQAASFDCARAQTKIENIICADSKLSALDEELAHVYKDALRLTTAPDAMRKAQAAWLKQKRAASANPEDIQAAYLGRIEEIRLDPGLKKPLFAAGSPPSSIFGRYSKTEPLCFNPKDGADEYDCSGEPVESYIDITAGPGNAVTVAGELWFFNGHACGPFGGKAEWVHDSLRMLNLEDEENRCVLIMRFKEGKVLTEDPGSFCKGALLCGANAGFHNMELPKLTGPGPAAARGAQRPRKTSGEAKTGR